MRETVWNWMRRRMGPLSASGKAWSTSAAPASWQWVPPCQQRDRVQKGANRKVGWSREGGCFAQAYLALERIEKGQARVAADGADEAFLLDRERGKAEQPGL